MIARQAGLAPDVGDFLARAARAGGQRYTVVEDITGTPLRAIGYKSTVPSGAFSLPAKVTSPS